MAKEPAESAKVLHAHAGMIPLGISTEWFCGVVAESHVHSRECAFSCGRKLILIVEATFVALLAVSKQGVARLRKKVVVQRVILDTETTGLHPQSGDEVLSLSIISDDGSLLFNRLFRPVRKGSWPEASRINGIHPEDVAACRTFAQERSEVQAIIDAADEVIAYNIGFDLGFLEAEGIDFSGKLLTDTMREFGRATGIRDRAHKHWKWFKLSDAAAWIGYRWPDAPHSSLADAYATLAVQQWVEEQENDKA